MSIRDRIVSLERVRARDLRPHPLNPRQHPAGQSAQVKLLLEEIGMADRLLAYRDLEGKLRLIDGHLRRSLAGDQEVPVLVTDLNEEEAAMLLAVGDPLAGLAQVDNRVMEELLAQTDGDLLAELLAAGDGLAELLGREAPAVGGLLPGADPDAIPETIETRCQAGDLWALGEHRLLCGDSTDAAAVRRLMNGERAQMVFTDPPYNVDYSADSYSDGRAEKWGRIKNDALGASFPAFCEAFAETLDAVVENGAVYVCAPMRPAGIQIRQALEKRFQFKDTIVWTKDHFVVGRNDYHPQYEDVLYCFKGKRHWSGARDQSNVWTFSRVLHDRAHPTQKPVSLIEKALANSSEPKALVVDIFGGSGSTLIACENQARRCFTSELSPAYCDVILQRFETLTGREAVRLEAG